MKILKTEFGYQILTNRSYRTVTFAVFGLILNLLYAFCHGALGIVNHSVWFITSCVYYVMLSAMRFSALWSERKNRGEADSSLMRITGIMFSVLSVILIAILYLSLTQNIASKYNTIGMITIATYTFTKVSMAIVTAVKHRKETSPHRTVMQNIRYMEVAVSVLTLQRSMLVTFGDRELAQAHTLNMLTGAGVCLFALSLGIRMTRNSKRKKA